MATEFIMPKLGLTMEAGTITEWYVDDGAAVTAGMPVLSITTDKTDSDVEASNDGLLHLVGEVGDTYECGELIGWFLEPGETPPARTKRSSGASVPAASGSATAVVAVPAAVRPDGARIFASPNARRIAAERGIDLASVVGSGPNHRIVSEDLEGVSAGPPASTPQYQTSAAGAGLATFAARSLADLLGVNLAAVSPDERSGKVTREGVAAHVRALLAGATGAAQAPTTSLSMPLAQEPSSYIPMSGMRGIIADRMRGSLREMAQLTLFMDADLDAIVEHRAQQRAEGTEIGYTDYLVAAVARALRDHPIVNSQVTDDGIALLPDIHIGVAVAVDDGLIVPVVRDPGAMSLAELAAETTRLAEAARGGSLALTELEGGTFSVSALGMFGVDGFTPVINPPNAAILGVGRLRTELVLDDDGSPREVTRMTLSLTWDHRVLDGAPAAAFCRSIVDALAEPASLD